MKQNFLLFIFCFSSMIFLGGSCSNPPPPPSEPVQQTENPESYYVEFDYPVSAEYSPRGGGTYYFIKNENENEERYIYVCGYTPESKYAQVSLFTSGGALINSVTLKNDKNYYFKDTRYTAPLSVHLKEGATGYVLKLCDASGNSFDNGVSVEMQPIAKREYAIEYSYATGYDVFTFGTNYTSENMRGKIDGAFVLAGTTISWCTYRSDLPVLIDYNVDNPIGDNQLFAWAMDNQSAGKEDHDYHFGPIFSLKDIKFVNNAGYPATAPIAWDDPTTGKVRTGISVAAVTTQGQRGGGGYSMVFIDRINRASLNGDELKREFDRTVVHELGHQRGIAEPNDNHTLGHNGIQKTICIMFNPENFPSTTEGKARLSQYRQTALFCEGHKQKLLNFTW